MNLATYYSLANSSLRSASAGMFCMLLGLCSFGASAGDLNAEVNNMFTNLGGVGNYTAPGAFKGQVSNTYTGGNFYLRVPTKRYQLASIQFPNAKGGCGGIDSFAGSFSHISGQEFKNMLKNITAALPGIAFQVAMDVLSPLLGGVTKWAQPYVDMINNARINSCETAVSMVASAAQAIGFDEDEACGKVAVAMGDAADADQGKAQCQKNRKAILTKAKSSADPAIRNTVPATGNLVWQALKSVDTIDDRQREFIMSMVGTFIYPPLDQPGERIPIVPTITSATKLLYGDASAGPSDVTLTLLKCNNYTDCDVVTQADYVHTPFLTLVTSLMTSISDHIRTRSALPNNSPEIGFVNQVSEPVYKMMSVGNSIPSLGTAEALINQYAGVIAADYAHTFLEHNIRIGLGVLLKTYTLNDKQQKDFDQLLANARQLLTALGQEKIAHYAKVTKFTSIVTHLETLERQLRTSMPQSLVDMLGYQSVALSK